MCETPDARLSGFRMSLAIWGAAVEGRYDGLACNLCEDRVGAHRSDTRWWDRTAPDLAGLHVADGRHREQVPDWWALAGHPQCWWDRQPA